MDVEDMNIDPKEEPRTFFKYHTDHGRRYRCKVCKGNDEYSCPFNAREHAQIFHDYGSDKPYFVPDDWKLKDEFDVLEWNRDGERVEP